jgi:hypothetical protein
MEDKMKKVFLIGFLILTFLGSFALAGDNYVLIFQITEYNSKIGDTVKYFFKEIFKHGDQLSILSPVKPYGFSKQTLESQTSQQLIELTKKVLKRDTTIGAANYQQVLDDMIQVVLNISSGTDASYSMGGGTLTGADLKTYLVQYRQLLENMRNIRKLNEALFIKLAELFKKQKGKNYIYLFYQKELRVIPSRNAMDNIMQSSQNKFEATELFKGESSEEFIDVEKVIQSLKDLATLHFIYVNKEGKRRQGMQFKEFSGDIYNVFSKIARATGGVIEATSKPAASLEKIAKASKK